jgi:hypothetical protein
VEANAVEGKVLALVLISQVAALNQSCGYLANIKIDEGRWIVMVEMFKEGKRRRLVLA